MAAAGRRTSLASLAGAKVETVPGHSDPTLVRLTLPKVVPTPLNPRTDFGTAESLTELGDSMRRRQLQPVVVVSRATYLKLFPEHAEQVGAAAYIIANGERRYRAARQVGLDSLEAVIREEVADSRQDFLDAVLSENIDRKNFDPIEEAHAVDMMVKECGTASAAAARYGRTDAWVSQRRALLRLDPQVQALVRAGDIPVREARQLATLPTAEQAAAWRARLEQRTAEKAKPRAPRQLRAVPDAAPVTPPAPAVPAPVSAPAKTPSVPVPAPARVEPEPAPAVTAGGGASAASAATPGPAAGTQDETSAEVMPWDNPVRVLAIASQRMTPADFEELLKQAARMTAER